MSKKPDILIIGLGNPYRNDDGIGFYIIDQLQNSSYKDVELIKMNPDGYQLIEAWKDQKWVILIDAAVSDEPVGTVKSIDALNEELPRNLRPVSSHSINLAETISLARTLNQLPEHLQVYAIEARNFEHGNELTSEVKEAGSEVLQEIYGFIQKNCE